MTELRTKNLLPLGNRPHPRTPFYCCVCHKDMNPSRPYRLVRVIRGGMVVLHPGDEAKYVTDAGDLGGLPIGNDCARELGMEWTSAP